MPEVFTAIMVVLIPSLRPKTVQLSATVFFNNSPWVHKTSWRLRWGGSKSLAWADTRSTRHASSPQLAVIGLSHFFSRFTPRLHLTARGLLASPPPPPASVFQGRRPSRPAPQLPICYSICMQFLISIIRQCFEPEGYSSRKHFTNKFIS